MVILEKVLVLRKHVLKHLGIQGVMSATYFQMIQENRERTKERPRGKINNCPLVGGHMVLLCTRLFLQLCKFEII